MKTKEFFSRWKQGIMAITPLQIAEINIMGGSLVLIGVIIGLITTFIIGMKWLFIVLLGSLFLTGTNMIGIIQRYITLKDLDRQLKLMNPIPVVERGEDKQDEKTI